MSHDIDPKYGVPILGTAKATEGPNAPGLTSNFDIHDSEVMEIEKVAMLLRERYSGKRAEYAAMDIEIRDRFAAIGFKVSVGWWTTNVEGVLIPEISITDRTERGHEFDHDQKVHEITNDILELGDKGAIATTPAQFDADNYRHLHQDHGH